MKFEKLLYESQESNNNINKFKRDLGRLKSDLNFLLLSNFLNSNINNENQMLNDFNDNEENDIKQEKMGKIIFFF